MKAALCRTLDGPAGLSVETVPDPVPAVGEAVVRVAFAALNFFDTLITRGKYQSKPALPFSPCGEFAGVIESFGPGHDAAAGGLVTGQRVTGYTGYGCAVEKIAVPAATLVPVPDAVSLEAASGLAITYGTALHGLASRGRMAPGETVAVIGAAGGAGLAAVEIAAVLGARVIAVASGPEKLSVAKAHGAALGFDYSNGALLKEGLRDLTGGLGVDIVYDCVGGPHSLAALRALNWGGRLLVVGFASGEIPSIALNHVLIKGCDIVGVFWGEAVRRDPHAHHRDMTRLLGWVADGRLNPLIHSIHPLREIALAMAVIERREAQGKVLIGL